MISTGINMFRKLFGSARRSGNKKNQILKSTKIVDTGIETAQINWLNQVKPAFSVGQINYFSGTIKKSRKYSFQEIELSQQTYQNA